LILHNHYVKFSGFKTLGNKTQGYIMKADIHPNYVDCTVKCACGNTFETKSTKGEKLKLEICSNCHPFYTGKQKILDTAGRIEKFNRRYGLKK